MMTLHEFNYAMRQMTANYDEYDSDSGIQLKKRPFRSIYKRCVREFDDRNRNLKRWLLGSPCVYKHPVTGNIIDVEIGKDIEALYYFLLLCYKINNEEPVSNDFSDYLALVISRSLYQYDGD